MCVGGWVSVCVGGWVCVCVIVPYKLPCTPSGVPLQLLPVMTVARCIRS